VLGSLSAIAFPDAPSLDFKSEVPLELFVVGLLDPSYFLPFLPT